MEIREEDNATGILREMGSAGKAGVDGKLRGAEPVIDISSREFDDDSCRDAGARDDCFFDDISDSKSRRL